MDSIRPAGSLPPALAIRLRSVTGYDFSALRVHADAESGRTTRALGAKAFTTGHDVFLGAGTDASDEATLAHEAVHAAQQGAVSHRSSLAGSHASITQSPPGVPQLKPGENADESWRSMVKEELSIPDDPAIGTRGAQARSRFLQAAEGQRLINNLFNVSTKGGTSPPRFDLDVTYRTELPRETDGLHASGWFQPRVRDAKHYKIHVKDVLPPQYGSRRLPGARTGEGVPFSHTDPESDMSATLHHELEHVEFMRTGAGVRWETGHGDVEKGEVEPAFRDRIAAFEGDLDAVEDRIHKAAQEANQPAAAAPVPDLDAASPKAVAPTSPPFAGLRLSGGGGIGTGGGTKFTGVAGADLVLGRINSLNLGVRGIYLTPDRLLAGGTIGYRSVQSGESKLGDGVQNPLFFDVEAGVVGQLNGTEQTKVMRNAGFFASAGVGQEYGTAGTRFFWRVGGYVIVSDRKEAFGGGTVGVGVHFQ
ncbi:MAG TPA: DUF4157 domain-containing protein [Candidatus Limnocylindrales bacterium]|nr:DUF4157 domain-containing protein [Candidatus Limnocylindrales bacterium]